jgi:hypothetical protein
MGQHGVLGSPGKNESHHDNRKPGPRISRVSDLNRIRGTLQDPDASVNAIEHPVRYPDFKNLKKPENFSNLKKHNPAKKIAYLRTQKYPPRRWCFVKSSQAGQKQPITFMEVADDCPRAQKSSVGWCFSRECFL